MASGNLLTDKALPKLPISTPLVPATKKNLAGLSHLPTVRSLSGASGEPGFTDIRLFLVRY